MLKYKRVEHRFVKHVPEVLEPGVLYVSVEFGTVVHSCCCGCGAEVVTPLTPTDWHITYDGESVSLWPSVGSWQIKCRSHYIIDRGRVVGSSAWTPAQIAAQQRRDRAAKANVYSEQTPLPDARKMPASTTGAAKQQSLSRWDQFRRWWKP